MHYVYFMENKQTKQLYYGYTNNVERRLAEHNSKKQEWELIYFEAFKAESDARVREKRLKNYAQALTALKGRLGNSLI